MNISGTLFTVPEEKITAEDNVAIDLFYICMGDCVVTQRRINQSDSILRVLVEGNHFGEIPLLYKCKRTCTIISRNYNMMARISYGHFKLFLSLYPRLKKELSRKIYSYDDENKTFLMKLIKKLQFGRRLKK